MRAVSIHTERITLAQLLKLADVAPSGGYAREILASKQVRVNGEIEERRGRKLFPGDVVSIESHAIVLKIVRREQGDQA